MRCCAASWVRRPPWRSCRRPALHQWSSAGVARAPSAEGGRCTERLATPGARTGVCDSGLRVRNAPTVFIDSARFVRAGSTQPAAGGASERHSAAAGSGLGTMARPPVTRMISADALTLMLSNVASGGSAPVPVPGIDTADDEINVAVTAAGREPFFSSDRGGNATHAIWRASRNCQ